MHQDLGWEETGRGKAGDSCREGKSTTDAVQSSGLPAWPPRPRPHFALANPIIAERERQLVEIRRSRRNMGGSRLSYTLLA
jgi:hypothetical protein